HTYFRLFTDQPTDMSSKLYSFIQHGNITKKSLSQRITRILMHLYNEHVLSIYEANYSKYRLFLIELVSAANQQLIGFVKWNETRARPETPGAARPETPGAARPETPGAARPETPGAARPETPGAARPETPGAVRPETPGAARPETPGAARPETPGAARPETPGAARPETPGRNGKWVRYRSFLPLKAL
uniref:Uncharacterized protein n=1 Tax=Cyclopterus lumpus TaxID=8103 RepID=A0A8C3G1M3_CYCLU